MRWQAHEYCKGVNLLTSNIFFFYEFSNFLEPHRYETNNVLQIYLFAAMLLASQNAYKLGAKW